MTAPHPESRRLGTRALALAAALACLPAWSLDLSQAYQAALEQDATLRAVRAATDAKRERLPQARAQLLPNLSASAIAQPEPAGAHVAQLSGRRRHDPGTLWQQQRIADAAPAPVP
jgi:outer membrane protein TolC